MEKLKMHSPNLTDENIVKIRELFPGCVTEATDENGKLRYAVDFDQLRQELSDQIVEGPQERYSFNWPGKRQALIAANAPIAKTLRPDRKESKDFDRTQNLFIEGDNLETIKIIQNSYMGKVKMIYLDPPYNTGRDFVYRDKFAENVSEYLKNSFAVSDSGEKLLSNPDYNGRFHSNWLNMIYSRLRVARNLLADDGVIFISIDDVEMANLFKVCCEVFGESNFIGCAGRITKKSNNKGQFWAPNFDYIMTFVKNAEFANPFFGGVNLDAYSHIDDNGPRAGEPYQLVRLYMSTIQNRNPEQRFWIECPDGSRVIPPGSTFPPERPNLGDGIWRWTRKKFEEERESIVVKEVRSSNLVSDSGEPAKWNVYTKTYLADVIKNASAKPNSFIEGHINQSGSHELGKLDIPFSYSKPTSLIMYLMEIAKVSDRDIVADFFAGSATTADAVMSMNAKDGGNRRFIVAQIQEGIDENEAAYKAGFRTINEIGKERINRRGDVLLKGDTHKNWNRDVGFRLLRVDSTNMRETYYSAGKTHQKSLLDAVENVKSDRTDPEDLLFQVLVDWGVDLTLPIHKEAVQEKTVFFVNEEPHDLIACFDYGVTEELVKELAKYEPARVVFRDNGFASDSVKINVEQIFKQLSPATDVKSI